VSVVVLRVLCDLEFGQMQGHIYTELTQFEKSLQTHARIENEILFPKAMALENQMKRVFSERVKHN